MQANGEIYGFASASNDQVCKWYTFMFGWNLVGFLLVLYVFGSKMLSLSMLSKPLRLVIFALQVFVLSFGVINAGFMVSVCHRALP